MLKQVLSALLVAGSLWGCSASVQDTVLVREAWEERESGYARVARAISTYCAASNESPEARQRCVLERRLELVRLRQGNQDGNSPQFATPQALLTGHGNGNSTLVVRCERARVETTCRRIPVALAEPPGG